MLPFAGQMIVLASGTLCFGAVDRFLGTPAAPVLGRVAAYSRWRSDEAPDSARPIDHIKPAVAGELISSEIGVGRP